MGGIPINAPGPINPLPIADPALAVRKIPDLLMWLTPDRKDVVLDGAVVQSVAARAGGMSGMIRMSGAPALVQPSFDAHDWLYLVDRGAVADHFKAPMPISYDAARGLTIVALARPYASDGAGGSALFGLLRGETGSDPILSSVLSEQSFTWNYGAGGASVNYNPDVRHNGVHRMAWRLSEGTTLTINANSNAKATRGLVSTSAATARLVLGGRTDPSNNTGMTGYIGEFLVFARALTDSELATVWAYLNAVYPGLGVAP